MSCQLAILAEFLFSCFPCYALILAGNKLYLRTKGLFVTPIKTTIAASFTVMICCRILYGVKKGDCKLMLSIADHQIVIRDNYSLLGEWLTVTAKSSTSLYFSVRDCHQTWKQQLFTPTQEVPLQCNAWIGH